MKDIQKEIQQEIGMQNVQGKVLRRLKEMESPS